MHGENEARPVNEESMGYCLFRGMADTSTEIMASTHVMKFDGIHKPVKFEDIMKQSVGLVRVAQQEVDGDFFFGGMVRLGCSRC